MLLNKLQRWHKIAIGTDKDYTICGIKNAIGNHSHGDIYIRFLLFRPRDGIVAIRTLYLLVKVFSTDDFKAVAVDELVSIKECTLSTAFFGI